MSGWIHAREIVEEQSVSGAVDEYSKQYARFDKVYLALTWLLARRCHDLPGRRPREVDGVQYYLYKMQGDPMADTPDIVILYTFNDQQVNIIAVEAQECDENSE